MSDPPAAGPRCECGCRGHLQIGVLWCYTKPTKDGRMHLGYTWSGYVEEGWPLYWRVKKVNPNSYRRPR